MERIKLTHMIQRVDLGRVVLYGVSQDEFAEFTDEQLEKMEKGLNGEPVNCKCAEYETMENFKTDKDEKPNT